MKQNNELSKSDLTKQRIAVMRSLEWCWLSGLMQCGDVRECPEFPTAYTDGWNVAYNMEWMATLTPEEQRGVIVHEEMHKALRHLTVWIRLFEEDAMTANMACDFVVNAMIVETMKSAAVNAVRVVLPGKAIDRTGKGGNAKGEGHLYDSHFINWTAKQVYEYLRQNPPTQQNKGGGGGQDTHDYKSAKQQNSDNAKEQAQARAIEQAVRQGKIIQDRKIGKERGNLPRGIEELLEPTVNWREVLIDYVNSVRSGYDASTYRRLHRRSQMMGIPRPSTYSEQLEHVCVAPDTSGSISGKELSRGISETVNLLDTLRPELMDVMYWDTEVAGHERYISEVGSAFAVTTKPKGGGGTDPGCIIQKLKAERIKPDVLVLITDGYVGSWHENAWPCPVFVLCTTKDIIPPLPHAYLKIE